jgi:cyclohexyl-isocyanide hydratase
MQIGYLLFPDLTQLDLTGPLQVLSRLPGATSHIVAKRAEPVRSDCGLSLLPTTTFEACPELDLIIVPGGLGVADAIRDPSTVAFVRRCAAKARYVTSICTGAFLLGAAGLLRGKRATTHWAYHGLLPLVGAIPVGARVVRDGPVITGAGVTAGIDFALSVAAEVSNDDIARGIQLSIEYDPAPPYDAGSPGRAGAVLTRRLESFYESRLSSFREALAVVQGA